MLAVAEVALGSQALLDQVQQVELGEREVLLVLLAHLIQVEAVAVAVVQHQLEALAVQAVQVS